MNNQFNNGEMFPPYDPLHEGDPKSARKAFSVSAFSLLIILAVSLAAQFTLIIGAELLFGSDSWLFTSSSGMWITSFVPLYLFGIPAGLLLMRLVPVKPLEKKKMKPHSVLIAFLIAVCFANVGNYIGSFLSMLLSRGTAENALNDFAMDNNPIKIVVMVILAPFLEELIFRKAFIDRTHVYGEKTAVLLSGLLFGLFHTNMFQFFYATLIGLLLGYIYVRTGKLIYPFIIHALINFFGSVVAPFFLSFVDLELMETISEMELSEITEELIEGYLPQLIGAFAFLCYSSFWSNLAIAGFVFFLIGKKKVFWKRAENQLSLEQTASSAFMNVGMICFIVATVALTVVSVFLV